MVLANPGVNFFTELDPDPDPDPGAAAAVLVGEVELSSPAIGNDRVDKSDSCVAWTESNSFS